MIPFSEESARLGDAECGEGGNVLPTIPAQGSRGLSSNQVLCY